MNKTTIALGFVLAFAAAAYAEPAEWSPEKEQESVFTERKLEVFKHGIKSEWGYAAPQRDTFLVLHPKQTPRAKRCAGPSARPADRFKPTPRVASPSQG
jgi:hypothetical protein